MKAKINTTHCDIIGDIHGCASALEALLHELGYRECGAVFQHPAGRKAIFLGDYLDRGPEIRRTLQIVRGMIDAGNALGILGNHEVNALRYHQRGPDGEWLRAHEGTKRHQHLASLQQLAEPQPAEWAEWLDWLSRLPLWLELPGFRAVHAAWFDGDIDRIRGHRALAGAELNRLSVKDSEDVKAVSRLINGLEITLPEGEFFKTPDGKARSEYRSRWWDQLHGRTNREAVFPEDPRIGKAPCPAPDWHRAYPATAAPVFFGHYAVLDDIASPLSSNVACLDYGAVKGGRIGAYRWDGESTLEAERMLCSPQTEAYYG